MLHRAALWAAAGGARELALQLFDAAAKRYRAELRIEPLVRVRIHQGMVAARASRPGEPDPALEIERRLLTIDRIESLHPPFAMVEARSLVALWPSLVAPRSRPRARPLPPPILLRAGG